MEYSDKRISIDELDNIFDIIIVNELESIDFYNKINAIIDLLLFDKYDEFIELINNLKNKDTYDDIISKRTLYNRNINNIIKKISNIDLSYYDSGDELVKENYSDSDIDIDINQIDNIDTRNQIDNIDTRNQIDNIDTRNQIDNIDTIKKNDNIGTRNQIDNIDTKNQIDNIGTNKKYRKQKEEIDLKFWTNNNDDLDKLDWIIYKYKNDKETKYWKYIVKNYMFLSKTGKENSKSKGSYLQKTFNNEKEINKYIKTTISTKKKQGYILI